MDYVQVRSQDRVSHGLLAPFLTVDQCLAAEPEPLPNPSPTLSDQLSHGAQYYEHVSIQRDTYNQTAAVGSRPTSHSPTCHSIAVSQL